MGLSTIRKYHSTMRMSMKSLTNGGILYLLPGYLLKVLYLLPLLALWRILIQGGADSDGMSLHQFLTYTYMSTLLAPLLSIRTPLSDWLYDGLALTMFQRPMGLFGTVIAMTIGSSLPFFLLFSLPMAVLSPLFGVSLAPAGWWFLPSLLLCVSLGFAIDFIFACILIRMMNARYLVYCIRNALTWLLSGVFLPFAALPWGLGRLFELQPLGSLGGAVLGVYTGLSDPLPTLLLQVVWNLILWPIAIVYFRRSHERLVSHGG
ncbi:hypothetical protein LJC63_13090 [Ruminococcaceae bacterium OttesenSCG-928-L11]|nr:hypothetical protein [Ruminococcaceae bacterium OttesenSCG-928-L11]